MAKSKASWRRSRVALLASAVLPMFAQAAPALAQDTPQNEDEIVVTGTRIQGARVNATLPVTRLDQADVDAIGGVDGDDLIRALPSQGSVDFRSENTGTLNNARGDVASINLRSIGPGNTLVLLNGRRLVLHPGTQTDNSVPAVTINANALPVAGVQRVEVLNDGASAIYGSDAVAGVINYILRDDYEGLSAAARYGWAENTGLEESQLTLDGGANFNGGRTNVSFSAQYANREGVLASELPYSANDDLRPLFVGTSWEGRTSLDNRTIRTPWGEFTTLNTTSANRVRQGTINLTSAAGVFHIQPTSLTGCLGTTGTTSLAANSLCIDDGGISSTDNDVLKFNTGSVNTLIADRDRFNFFGFLNHDLENGVELYGEAGWYSATTHSLLEHNTSIPSGDIVVPANNYWNPFGPITSPNRLPNLVNVPAGGLPVAVSNARFRLVDVGPRRVDVENTSWRVLGGARGDFGENWHWDSAALYSTARTLDTTNNAVSSTLFQAAISTGTPNDYNLFNGADPLNPGSLDSTPNPQNIIDPFLISVERESSTELGLVDFTLTNGHLLQLPGGPVGFAVGVEGRFEGYVENRDPRLDGTITYTNAVTGAVELSDVMGTSPTLDSDGSREVYAIFTEFAVPIIGPDQDIPLIESLDLQLAARYENYSDIGESGVRPRVAGSWRPASFLMFRGAWSEGFRAPNLLTLNEVSVARTNGRRDSIMCEAGLRRGDFATFAACPASFTAPIEERRNGNPNLEPEEDTNTTYGVVFEPRFDAGWLRLLNGLTMTADHWNIEQTNVVGIVGGLNHVSLDYALRVQGSFNPAVVRAAPTVDQVAFFAGTGLEPAGNILYIEDTYLNILPRTISGTDYAIYYSLGDTPLGDFDFKINAVEMTRYYIAPSSTDQTILDAQAAGLVDGSIRVANSGSILGVNGQPRWQGSASVTWRHDSGFGMGLFADYVGEYISTAPGLDINGDPYIVDDWLTFNVYFQYEGERGVLADTRLRFGINNFTDEDPPLVDSTFGFDGAYHNARGRFFYVDLRRQF